MKFNTIPELSYPYTTKILIVQILLNLIHCTDLFSYTFERKIGYGSLQPDGTYSKMIGSFLKQVGAEII